MKFALSLEDTPKGVRIDFTAVCSGCTDHAADSLSILLAAQIERLLAASVKSHALVLVPGDGEPMRQLISRRDS